MELIIGFLLAALLYLLQQKIYSSYWNKHLNIELEFSVTHCIEGEDASLIQRISNEKLLPLPILRLKFQTSKFLSFYDTKDSQISDLYYRNDLISLMMYQKLTRSLKFRANKRGYYRMNQCNVVCSDLFIYSTHVENFPLNLNLYVYPKYIDFVKIAPTFHKILGNVISKRFTNEDPFEFAGIRQYQIYDNLKSVNWNASAKTGELKVNVHDTTSSQEVKILLNLELQSIWVYDELLEESIRITASLANLFIKQGIPTGIYSNACDSITKEPLTIPAGSSNNHLTSICEGLSRLDTSLIAKPFVSYAESILMNKKESDYTIIISFYQKDDLQNILRSTFRKNQNFHWIIPYNKDISIQVEPYFQSNITPWTIKDMDGGLDDDKKTL